MYNPTCEMAVQNNSVSYQPPLRLQEFERAMSSLMMFISQEGDYVVGEAPDDELLLFWKERGVYLPQFVSKNDAISLIKDGAILIPWGGSRQLYYSYGLKHKSEQYTDLMRCFFSRELSVVLEDTVCRLCQGRNNLKQYDIEERSVLVTERDIMERRVKMGNCVVKSLWSSSGRGVQLVREQCHIEPAIVWARGKIRHDGGVVCEPFYKRLGEFTTLIEIYEDGRIEYLGTNYFEADEAGRFGKELIGQNILTREEEQEVGQILIEAMSRLNWVEKYIGKIGVDGMVYNDKRGERKVRICTEVNMRHTMGNINLSVARCFSPKVKATWQIEQFDNAMSWARFCKEMDSRFPLVLDDKNRIECGFFRLSSLGYNYGAWGIVQG